MGDVFKEQIVKKKPTTMDMMKRVGLVAAVIVIFLVASVFIGQFAFVLTVVAGFCAYLVINMLNVEYEYIFTNGELDIDIIYNRTRRKRLFSGSVSDFEIMAHLDDKDHAGEFASANETKNYASGTVTEQTYAFLTVYKGKRLKVIIEPNEMMLKAISGVLTPRKLHKKM